MPSSLFLKDEAATGRFGAALAKLSRGGGLITVSGGLGTGKTTLCRGLIRAAGHGGAVRSPTFTLLEPYELPDRHIVHCDFYRLEDPEELEFLGLRDYLDGNTLCLVEWPEKGAGHLPKADLALRLEIRGAGRQVSWRAATTRGKRLGRELRAKFVDTSANS